jgi:coproporphyrinogen III oxidase-like Fe-S oxidoreductase
MEITRSELLQNSECFENAVNYFPLPGKRDMSFNALAEKWQVLLKNKRNNARLLSLYVHIPFCAQRCKYCSYFSFKPAHKQQIDNYLEYLFAMIDFFSPLFKHKAFTHPFHKTIL